MKQIKIWKHFAERSWPSLHCHDIGAYRVRDNGEMGGSRANSVECIGAYAQPPQYNRFIIWPEDKKLASKLAMQGYKEEDNADVLWKPLEAASPNSTCVILPKINAALEKFYITNSQDTARIDIMRRTSCTKFFVTYRETDTIKGACYIAIEAQKSWLYALDVDKNARRHGIGRFICEAAMNEALQRGAKEMAIMVRPQNIPAYRLYQRLGFEKISQYHFMVRKGA